MGTFMTPRRVIIGVCLIIIFILSSCAPVKYVPVEDTKLDSVRIHNTQRDSIYVLDSVFVQGRNDTVYKTRWRIEYRVTLKVDTFFIERSDTINRVVEVEKKLTKIESIKLGIGTGVMYAVPILIALYLLYRKFIK